MTMTDEQGQLSWRIPDDEPSLTFRVRVLQMLFAGVFVAGVLMVFGTREMRLPGLVGILLVMGLTLLFVWRTYRRRTADDNIRIDREGLHWNTDTNSQHTIPRDQMRQFRIGLDRDTVRAQPALTFILADGFESQPIELHAPATPNAVRKLLNEQLRLTEESPDQARFAARLRETLSAIILAQSPAAHWQLLHHSLVEPQPNSNGHWLVGRLPRSGEIHYETRLCVFRARGRTGEPIELPTLSDVADFARDYDLPSDQHELHLLLEKLLAEEDERLAATVSDEARAARFYVEIDSHGHWHFAGSRGGLLAVCQRIEDAASLLKPAPLGAKSPQVRIGGSHVGITLELGEPFWIGDLIMRGSADQLRRAADRLNETIAQADARATSSLQVSDNPRHPLMFHFHVMSDDFDPGAPNPIPQRR